MADDLEDLDEAVRRHDPDRWLATRFIADHDERADVIALYAFNYELARVAGAVSNSLMGEIRLTWWSEALDEIFENRPVRKHPVTLALTAAIRRRSLPEGLFRVMIEARYPELDGIAADKAKAEGPLYALASSILGGPGDAVLAVAAGTLSAARSVPAKQFPAIAHLSVAGVSGPLRRRLKITWAVLTGKL